MLYDTYTPSVTAHVIESFKVSSVEPYDKPIHNLAIAVENALDVCGRWRMLVSVFHLEPCLSVLRA